MRIIFLLLFSLVFQLQAEHTYSQNTKISLEMKNSSIEKILQAIEEKTEFYFLYNNKLIDVDRKTDILANEETIASILYRLFDNQNVEYEVKDTQIILHPKGLHSLSGSMSEMKQPTKKQITGKITDDHGEAIIGANIIEKGTTNGTITDIDGKFSFSVEEGAVLLISYIGYLDQEIPVGDKTSITVTLKEDLLKLDEVIVVGYGTARKSDLTGAVVRADLVALQESPNISLLGALQGLVPGLNVGATTNAGADPEFSIRGRTSISGTTSPLIVLDGIIYRGNIVDINVNDIESIDVLKDASATAIYGSQASNGVILITTKTGTVESKPVISYSGYVSLQQPTNDNLVPNDREGFLQMVADRFLSESRSGSDMLQMNPNWDASKYMMDINALEGYNNGTDTNWWDLMTNDQPFIQSHNVSIRGKSDLSGYFFSLGLLDQQNLIVNDRFKRYNVRINLDMKVTDWLKIGTQTSFTASDNSGTFNTRQSIDKESADPVSLLDDRELYVIPIIEEIMKLPPVVASQDSEGQLIRQPYKFVNNPLIEKDDQDLNRRYQLNGTFYADVSIPFIKGLSYRMNFSQYLRNVKDYNFSALAENFQGEAYKSNGSQYGWTLDNIFTYKKRFGKHDLDATLLYGAEKREYEWTTAGSKIFNNDILGYNKLDAGQADLQSAKSGAWEEASLYSMARVRYTFNDKYTFTGTIRRDGFSGFGENHKFGVFPSAAVAWRLNEENFMKNVDWLSNLKLRLSYGKSGNRTIGRYQTMAKLSSADGYVYGEGGSAEQRQWLSGMANADLKWETTNTFNVGIDFALFNNRVFGNMEYYVSNTNNLLYDINIPEINGISTIPSNIGEMGNKGFEMSVTTIPVKKKDFSWDVTFNFSTNKNEIKSILGIDADGDGREDDLVTNKIFIGQPYGVAYDYNIIGMWQVADYNNNVIPDGFTYGTYKVEDVNNDGNYTADKDRKILGYTDPLYRFSIQNTLRYKNWELKIFVNSIQGGKNHYLGQPGKDLLNPDNIYQNNSFSFDYWTPENPDARYRQLGYYTQALGYEFSPYVQRSFIRLQDITLSYSLPQQLLKKLSVSRMNLFITGKNLLTITDWDGWDPEIGTGLTLGTTPLMKSYTFGVNFEF